MLELLNQLDGFSSDERIKVWSAFHMSILVAFRQINTSVNVLSSFD